MGRGDSLGMSARWADLEKRLERAERAREAAADARTDEARAAAERASIARQVRVATAKASDSGKEFTDATVERLAKGEESDWVDPSRIDSHNQIVLVRRFRSSHLDRFYKRDKPERSILTFRQWYAGDLYRSAYARSGITTKVIASYGERLSSGEPNYGMPRTEAQAQAREMWREARNSIPRAMVGFIDRLLLHDELPKYGGKQRMKKLDDIRAALDCLADYFKLQTGTEWQLRR